MKQIIFTLAQLLMASSIIVGCSSVDDEYLNVNCSDELNSRAERVYSNPEKDLVLQYLQFEDNVFRINLSLEEAVELGVSEQTYNECLKYAETKNKEVQDYLAKGITYHFYNGSMDDVKTQVSKSVVSKENIESGRLLTLADQPLSGKLYFPDQMEINVYVPSSQCVGVYMSRFSNMTAEYHNGVFFRYIYYYGKISYKYIVTIKLPEEQYPRGAVHEYLLSNPSFEEEILVPYIKKDRSDAPHKIEFIAEIPEDPNAPYQYDHYLLVTAECKWRI